MTCCKLTGPCVCKGGRGWWALIAAAVLCVVAATQVPGCAALQAPADPAKPDGPTAGEKLLGDASAFTAFLPPPFNFIANGALIAAAAWLAHSKGKKTGATLAKTEAKP